MVTGRTLYPVEPWTLHIESTLQGVNISAPSCLVYFYKVVGAALVYYHTVATVAIHVL